MWKDRCLGEKNLTHGTSSRGVIAATIWSFSCKPNRNSPRKYHPVNNVSNAQTKWNKTTINYTYNSHRTVSTGSSKYQQYGTLKYSTIINITATLGKLLTPPYYMRQSRIVPCSFRKYHHPKLIWHKHAKPSNNVSYTYHMGQAYYRLTCMPRLLGPSANKIYLIYLHIICKMLKTIY